VVTEDVKDKVKLVLGMLMLWNKKDIPDLMKSTNLEELTEEVHRFRLLWDVDEQTLRDCLKDIILERIAK